MIYIFTSAKKVSLICSFLILLLFGESYKVDTSVRLDVILRIISAFYAVKDHI